jgi:hypothetical protein
LDFALVLQEGANTLGALPVRGKQATVANF